MQWEMIFCDLFHRLKVCSTLRNTGDTWKCKPLSVVIFTYCKVWFDVGYATFGSLAQTAASSHTLSSLFTLTINSFLLKLNENNYQYMFQVQCLGWFYTLLFPLTFSPLNVLLVKGYLSEVPDLYRLSEPIPLGLSLSLAKISFPFNFLDSYCPYPTLCNRISAGML